jgi:hypothetical protein
LFIYDCQHTTVIVGLEPTIHAMTMPPRRQRT